MKHSKIQTENDLHVKNNHQTVPMVMDGEGQGIQVVPKTTSQTRYLYNDNNRYLGTMHLLGKV